MRVLTFSRTYPGYHPKAGEPTHFVEKILQGRNINPIGVDAFQYFEELNTAIPASTLDPFVRSLQFGWDIEKHHTIRAGHRWKEGDWFSPRVWSGKPYGSKQIQFAPPIQVKRTWDFEMDILGVCAIAKPGEQVIYTFEYDDQYPDSLDNEIAKNDGLSPEDFYWWFSRSPDFKKNEGFAGQIIAWSESIEY